jgi:hypothetical protein
VRRFTLDKTLVASIYQTILHLQTNSLSEGIKHNQFSLAKTLNDACPAGDCAKSSRLK